MPAYLITLHKDKLKTTVVSPPVSSTPMPAPTSPSARASSISRPATPSPTSSHMSSMLAIPLSPVGQRSQNSLGTPPQQSLSSSSTPPKTSRSQTSSVSSPRTIKSPRYDPHAINDTPNANHPGPINIRPPRAESSSPPTKPKKPPKALPARPPAPKTNNSPETKPPGSDDDFS